MPKFTSAGVTSLAVGLNGPKFSPVMTTTAFGATTNFDPALMLHADGTSHERAVINGASMHTKFASVFVVYIVSWFKLNEPAKTKAPAYGPELAQLAAAVHSAVTTMLSTAALSDLKHGVVHSKRVSLFTSGDVQSAPPIVTLNALVSMNVKPKPSRTNCVPPSTRHLPALSPVHDAAVKENPATAVHSCAAALAKKPAVGP
jgi:hypothetical protein